MRSTRFDVRADGKETWLARNTCTAWHQRLRDLTVPVTQFMWGGFSDRGLDPIGEGLLALTWNAPRGGVVHVQRDGNYNLLVIVKGPDVAQGRGGWRSGRHATQRGAVDWEGTFTQFPGRGTWFVMRAPDDHRVGTAAATFTYDVHQLGVIVKRANALLAGAGAPPRRNLQTYALHNAASKVLFTFRPPLIPATGDNLRMPWPW